MAYKIIGGGEEGNKTIVQTKEQADHSLPYMVAAALLDGEVMPEQYRPERILSPDVQELLKRVIVRPSDDLSRRFPAQMPCRLTVYLRDGRALVKEKTDYEGFKTRPMSWSTVVLKFERLADEAGAGEELTRKIEAAVQHLDGIKVRELTKLLALAGAEA